MAFQRLMGLQVIDQDQYTLYRQHMRPILEQHQGRFVADFKIQETLLPHRQINRVFILEFPDQTHMQAFFKHPEYLAVREQYFDASVAEVFELACYNT